MDEDAKAARDASREKREARRAKQRAENAGRAAKMHAARVAWEAEYDPPAVAALEDVHVGCSGWFYWHGRRGFYPAELPTGGWFSHYADRFKTVELMLYAFRSDTSSHIWNLCVISVIIFARCFVGRSARQPSMAS